MAHLHVLFVVTLAQRRGQQMPCCGVGLRLSPWRERKLLRDALSPLPDVGPVAEVSPAATTVTSRPASSACAARTGSIQACASTRRTSNGTRRHDGGHVVSRASRASFAAGHPPRT